MAHDEDRCMKFSVMSTNLLQVVGSLSVLISFWKAKCFSDYGKSWGKCRSGCCGIANTAQSEKMETRVDALHLQLLWPMCHRSIPCSDSACHYPLHDQLQMWSYDGQPV